MATTRKERRAVTTSGIDLDPFYTPESLGTWSYGRDLGDPVAAAIGEFGPLARHYQIASPPDRGEPHEGELNYRWLFRRIDASGFTGWIGCEYRPRQATIDGLGWAAACGVTLG